MSLDISITPKAEIDNSKLIIVHLFASHVKCPKCRERNPLSTDFWNLITGQHFNDVPGCCPVCRILYTIHVNPNEQKTWQHKLNKNRVQMAMFAK